MIIKIKIRKKGKQGQKEHKFDNNVPFRSPLLLNTRPVVNLLESSISLRKFYSTKYNPDPVVPILKYDNAYLKKKTKKNKQQSLQQSLQQSFVIISEIIYEIIT